MSEILHKVDKITGVLLAGGWIDCEPGSFEVAEDACYGALDVNRQPAGMKTQGRAFAFREPEGDSVSGPLTSVLATREA